MDRLSIVFQILAAIQALPALIGPSVLSQWEAKIESCLTKARPRIDRLSDIGRPARDGVVLLALIVLASPLIFLLSSTLGEGGFDVRDFRPNELTWGALGLYGLLVLLAGGGPVAKWILGALSGRADLRRGLLLSGLAFFLVAQGLALTDTCSREQSVELPVPTSAAGDISQTAD